MVGELEMGTSIRKADITDAPALATLLRELGLFKLINLETATATTERLTKQLALNLADGSHLILVAHTTQGELVGYSAAH